MPASCKYSPKIWYNFLLPDIKNINYPSGYYLCKKYGIPSADYETFYDAESAISYIESKNMPIVVKANGLAAGKGVIIAENLDEGIDAVQKNFSGAFSDAGKEIIIEEPLSSVIFSLIKIWSNSFNSTDSSGLSLFFL